MRPATARLFTALWPDPATRHALAAAAGRWTWPAAARRVAAQKLHLTLHFIGNVPLPQVAALAAALRTAADDVPFELVLDRAEVWRSGIALLAPSQTPASLAALHRRQADVLHALGLPVEARRFRPHVTLARDAPATQVVAVPPVPPIVWRASPPVLVQSLPDGRYRPLDGAATISAPT